MNYTLEKLEVYSLAESVADEIWEIVSNWRIFLQDTIGKQNNFSFMQEARYWKRSHG